MKSIPKIKDLYDSLESDFKNKLDLEDDNLKKVLTAFQAVMGAQLKLLNLYLSDIQNNIFPDTADLAENGGTLERIGQIHLGRGINVATVGEYELNVTGTPGSILRASLTFKSNEGSKNPGALYVLDSEYQLIAGVNVITVRALEAGTSSDLNVADTLTITEPVIGVDQGAVVSAVITPASAAESVDNYRQAILNAIQLEPQGGAKTDYRLWAADAPGVQAVYPYVRQANAGIIDIYVEATEIDSIDQLGTPSAALLDLVTDVIELDPDESKPLYERGRRPIQAIIETSAISLVPIDVQIIGLAENSAAITAAIDSNLSAYLKTVRPYIAGADLPRAKNDYLYSGRLQSIVTDVLDSDNFYTAFIMQVDGAPSTAAQFTLGNIPYLRNLTF